MNELTKFRENIDKINKELIELLGKRFELVKKVGKYKKENDLTPLQPGRWQEVLEQVKNYGIEKGLSPKFIENVWNEIHEYALEIEKEI